MVMSITLEHEILRQLSEINRKVDSVEDNLSEQIDEVKKDLGGKDGIRERLVTLELTVANLADRENTPVNIVTTNKRSMKEQATLYGTSGGVGAIILYMLQLAGEYLKTK